MSGKPIPKRVINGWQKKYGIPDVAERILNTYHISCEAKELIATHGEEAVGEALQKVVSGDRSSATRLSRVCEFPKSKIDRATEHVRKSEEMKEQHRTSTTPDQRGRLSIG